MKLDVNLLRQLCVIEHPSKAENEMISFILNYCYKIPNITIELDHYNNLFITKNTTNPQYYPCVVAHMDCVPEHKHPFEVVPKGTKWYGRYIKGRQQCGVGFDDANGVCVALQMLKKWDNLKCVFTVEEELGAKGAVEATFNEEFFKDVQVFLQADRRGKSDLITHTNGITVCSDEFFTHIADICDKYDYLPNWGTYTDVGVLVDALEISGVNISCGYYHEHTWKEYTEIKELQNCLNFIDTIIESLQSVDKIFTITEKEQDKSTYYNERWCKSFNNKWDYSYGVRDYSDGHWDASGAWVDDDPELSYYFEDAYHKTPLTKEEIAEFRREVYSVDGFDYDDDAYQAAVDMCARCTTMDCINCWNSLSRSSQSDIEDRETEGRD